MNELRITCHNVPAMNQDSIDKVRALESFSSANLIQIPMDTFHIIHGGMYARTIMVPAGIMVTGVLIRVATILIVQGHTIVYVGDGSVEYNGYHVLPASAGRKTAVFAKSDTYYTFIYPTSKKNIHDAEEEFTDEADLLFSRKNPASNHIIITGE